MRKINEYTRYLTVFLCILQSWIYLRTYIMATGSDGMSNVSADFLGLNSTVLHFGWQLTAIAIMTCGTMFLMWLGEQIDEYGIGNGISLLIMASILAQMPKAFLELKEDMTYQLSGSSGQIGPDTLDRDGESVCGCCLWCGVYHLGAASHTNAKCQARAWSSSLWWYEAVLATAFEPGWGYADHFRQQLDHVARVCCSR